jgi:predicted nucleic acid-binding protein
MVFLDTNLILEIVLNNRPHVIEAQQFLETLNEKTALSTLSVHLIMHFGRKERIEDSWLQGVIAQNELIALTAEDYAWAIRNERGRDFEDALQLAMAVRSGCQTFVTFDAALAVVYSELPIHIVNPRS